MKSLSIIISLILTNSFLGSNLLAQIASPLSNDAESAYNGHRVQVSNIQAVKRTKKSLKFKCTVTNTGLQPLFLGKYRKHDTLPLVVIDTAELNAHQLLPYFVAISEQVLKVPVILQVGQTIVGVPIEIQYDQSVKQNYQTASNANQQPSLLPPLTAQEKTPTLEEPTIQPFDIVENQSETDKDKSATFANRTADTLQPIAHIDSTNILPHSVAQVITPISPQKVEEKSPEKPNKKEKNKKPQEPKKEPTPQKVEKPQEPKKEPTPQKVEKPQEPKKEPTPQKVEKPQEPKKEPTPQKVEKPQEPKKDTIIPPPAAIVATEPQPVDSNACPDLTIDAVRIVEKSAKYVKIEFVIFNKGNAPVNLWGATRKLEDNVSVQFYANGTPRLTRGSLIIDGIYIQDGLKDTKGILAPNKGVKQIAKVSTEKVTRYTRVIILRIDGFDVVSECDETNNTNSVIPDL